MDTRHYYNYGGLFKRGSLSISLPHIETTEIKIFLIKVPILSHEKYIKYLIKV